MKLVLSILAVIGLALAPEMLFTVNFNGVELENQDYCIEVMSQP